MGFPETSRAIFLVRAIAVDEVRVTSAYHSAQLFSRQLNNKKEAALALCIGPPPRLYYVNTGRSACNRETPLVLVVAAATENNDNGKNDNPGAVIVKDVA